MRGAEGRDEPPTEAGRASRRPGLFRRLLDGLEAVELLVQGGRLIWWLLRGLWLAAGAIVRLFGDR
ncbi:hypothetical protein [Methylobacterium mesophilicum]|uniref:hypothetical protein n=1 Tax=Methylobacterium mesophilicum TaxID=39956 RepID=UPI002F2D1700